MTVTLTLVGYVGRYFAAFVLGLIAGLLCRRRVHGQDIKTDPPTYVAVPPEEIDPLKTLDGSANIGDLLKQCRRDTI